MAWEELTISTLTFGNTTCESAGGCVERAAFAAPLAPPDPGDGGCAARADEPEVPGGDDAPGGETPGLGAGLAARMSSKRLNAPARTWVEQDPLPDVDPIADVIPTNAAASEGTPRSRDDIQIQRIPFRSEE